MGAPFHAALLLGIALASGLASAQTTAPKRRIAAGIVEGAAGPLAGATVTLVGHQTGALFDGDVDVVEAQTDENGRWRASLIAGMPYFGYAAGPWVEGSCELSTVRGWFGAGAIVDFVCASRVNARTIDVRGAESWLARPGYRIAARPFVATNGPQVFLPFAIPLARAEDRLWAYPRAPMGRIEVQDERGFAVWRSDQSVESMADFAMSPPAEFACDVVDEAGAPIAGAKVFLRGDGLYDSGIDGIETTRVFPLRLLATTGADGRGRMVLPMTMPLLSPPTSPNRMFVARAPGYAEQVCGARGNDVFVDGERHQGAVIDVLRFRLVKSAPLLSATKKLGEGARVQLRQVAKLRVGKDVFLHDNRSSSATIGPDGSLSMEGVDPDLHMSQWIVHPSVSEPPIALAMREGSAKVADFEDGLLQLGTVEIEAIDERAGPASGQCVYARREFEDPDQGNVYGSIRYVTDSGGKVKASLREGWWLFLAITPQGYAAARVDVAAGGEHAVALRGKPWPLMRGVVHDAAGAPIAGATFSLRPNWNISRSLSGLDWMIARWSLRMLPALSLTVRSAQDGSFAVALPAHGVLAAQIEPDAQNERFPTRMYEEPPRYSVMVSARGKRSVVIDAAAGDESVKVVLR